MDSSIATLQRHRQSQIRCLPDRAGVYALCDLDGVPLYVRRAGTSENTIRERVRLVFTGARSNLIVNRQLDVWEVGYVKWWVVATRAERTELEALLFHRFDRQSQLVNGTVPARPLESLTVVPEPNQIQVLPSELLAVRRDPSIRLQRQVQQFNQLLEYILNTQDKQHLRRALNVHHDRVARQLRHFFSTHETQDDD